MSFLREFISNLFSDKQRLIPYLRITDFDPIVNINTGGLVFKNLKMLPRIKSLNGQYMKFCERISFQTISGKKNYKKTAGNF